MPGRKRLPGDPGGGINPVTGQPYVTLGGQFGFPRGGQVGPQPPSMESWLEQLRKAREMSEEIVGVVGGEGGTKQAPATVSGRATIRSPRYAERDVGGEPAAAGAEGALGNYIDPTIRTALGSLMEGGMSPEEFDVERSKVTGGFQQALGGLSKATARKGFYAPQSVAQAAMGGPARALAGGLAGLAARRAQMRQQSIAQAGQIAAGLYGHRAQQQTARQQSIQNVMKGLMPDMPSFEQSGSGLSAEEEERRRTGVTSWRRF